MIACQWPGECPQPTYDGEPLCFYHRKVQAGLIEPSDAAEVRALRMLRAHVAASIGEELVAV